MHRGAGKGKRFLCLYCLRAWIWKYILRGRIVMLVLRAWIWKYILSFFYALLSINSLNLCINVGGQGCMVTLKVRKVEKCVLGQIWGYLDALYESVCWQFMGTYALRVWDGGKGGMHGVRGCFDVLHESFNFFGFVCTLKVFFFSYNRRNNK